MRAKITETLPDRGDGEHVTASPVGNDKWALDVKNRGTVQEIATDAVDSFDTLTNEITATAHAALAGDCIRFTSGVLNTREFTSFSVGTNTIKLGEEPDTPPSGTDTFTILRPICQTLSSTGGTSSINTFIRNGSNQVVTEDTGTPANNRPLPVKLIGLNGNLEVTAQNLNIQSTHTGANPDSFQIGDGTETAAVNVSKELQVADDTARTSLGTVATDTTSINGKTPALGSALVAASVPVTLASDHAALPLPTGASTSALQTSSEALLTTIDADTSALAGTVSGSEQQVDIVASLPAGTNNIGDVDVLSSALPTGAATSVLQTSSEALLTTIDADTSALAGTVSGSEQQVDVVTSALPSGAATEATLATIDTDTGNIATNTTRLDVVDLIDDLGDGAGIVFVANDNIDDSAGTFLTIVASTASDIKEIEILDTTGGYIGLFTGPGASEVLKTVLGPGSDKTIQAQISSGTRLSVRRMDSATVPLTSGFLAMNFLG